MTASRLAIIKTLVGCDEHVTADDLAQKVRANTPHVGRMTVYRTLELLCELGAVRPIYQGTGAAHYVLMTQGSHHHLICTRCHDVIEFDDCLAFDLADELAERFNFQIYGHLLELHGLCENCHE